MDASPSVPSTIAVGHVASDTDIALKEYILGLMAAKERENDLRFEASKQAKLAYIDALRRENTLQFESLKRETAQAMASAKEAVTKAEVSVDKRLEAMNEFRKSLNDQATTFMPRAECLGLVNGLDKTITEIKTKIDRGEGKSTGYGAVYGWILGGAALLFALLNYIRSVR